MLYKMTHVQVTEESKYKRRMHFCNWLFLAEYDSVLDPELPFFSDEAWFHLSGCFNLRQTSEVPLHDQKIGVWCAITAT
jgi:hypothetical protein